ncbi:MAG: recombinase family protein [Bacteroidetes bacterium]|nr:recombinase family protein [Bacteroidota bacterium]
MAVYGYLRVSTVDQDNDKFKNDILSYANDKKLGHIQFVEEKVSGIKNWKERALGKLINQALENDIIIVPELSRLARSIPQIYEIIATCQEGNIWLHIIKQNIIINGSNDITTKIMVSTFSLIAELERDFISLRTKEALAQKKKDGVKLGRPKGLGKSKLDAYADKIKGYRELGLSYAKIANNLEKKTALKKVNPQSVANWFNKH